MFLNSRRLLIGVMVVGALIESGQTLCAQAWSTALAVSATGQVARDSVGPLLAQLVQGDNPRSVAEAREALIRLIRSTPTDQQAGLARRVLAAVGPAIKHPQLICRLNAVLVLSELTDPAVLPALDQSLSDSSEAVRLRAAKGLAIVLKRAADGKLIELPAWGRATNHLLNSLGKQINNHKTSNRVRQEMFSVLAAVKTQDSIPVILDVLHQWTPNRLANLDEEFWAEHQAVISASSNMFSTEQLATKKLPNEWWVKLCAVSWRYEFIAAQAMQNADLDKETKKRYENLLADMDKTLMSAVPRLDGKTLQGNLPTNPALLQARVQTWALFLTDPMTINSPPTILNMSIPAP